ncbi:hypothetical protein SeMB42_g08009, partial [Synchytrium endobioticum]
VLSTKIVDDASHRDAKGTGNVIIILLGLQMNYGLFPALMWSVLLYSTSLPSPANVSHYHGELATVLLLHVLQKAPFRPLGVDKRLPKPCKSMVMCVGILDSMTSIPCADLRASNEKINAIISPARSPQKNLQY